MTDPPRPSANPIREFGIVLSRYCIASCGHCGSSSGPEARGWIDPALARRVLTEAAAVGVDGVIFTGGEPMARFELTRELTEHARACGMAPRICSNGYWGNRAARATAWAQALADAGLELLMLSTDRWHLPFVALESVVTAARAASAAGLPVQIAVPAGAHDFVALQLVSELEQRTDALVYTHPAHPVGRGECLPHGVLQWHEPGLEGCHLVGHVEVDHDGSVAISPTSADFPPTSPLVLGSAADEPLSRLLDRFRRTPLFGVIGRWGPLGVHVLLHGATGIDVWGLSGPVHDCHLCRAVHHDRDALVAFAEQTGIDLLTPVDPDAFEAVQRAVDERITEATTPAPTPVSVGARR